MKIRLPDKNKFNRYIGEGFARAGPLSFLENSKSGLLEARHGPP